jgi:hypothetical protein
MASRYPDTRGRCVSCGFLATHFDQGHEVTHTERSSGELVRHGGIWNRAECFRFVADLDEESGPGHTSPAKVRRPGTPVSAGNSDSQRIALV